MKHKSNGSTAWFSSGAPVKRAVRLPVLLGGVLATHLWPLTAWGIPLDWNTDSSGNFNSASNWTGGIVPDGDDIAIFRRGSDASYVVTFPGRPVIQGGTADYFSFRLLVGSNAVTFAQSSAPSIGPSTYTLLDAATSGDRGIIVGDRSGDMAVLSTSLLRLSAQKASIGHAAGATGTLNVSGGLLEISSVGAETALMVGSFGQGTVNVTRGGRLQTNGASIATFPGATGAVTVSGLGSEWNSGGLTVAFQGPGTLNILNGGTVQSTGGRIGEAFSGTVLVSGTGAEWRVDNLSVNLGTLSVADGGVVRAVGGEISPIGIASVSGAGSQLALADELVVLGSLEIDADGSVTTRRLNIAPNPSTPAAVNVTGGTLESSEAEVRGVIPMEGAIVVVEGAGSNWTNSGRLLLRNGASVRLRNGGHVTSREINIGGRNAQGVPDALIARVIVEDPGSTLTTSDLYVGGTETGAAGPGLLAIGGGSVNADRLQIWDPGELQLAGGTLNIAGTVTASADGDLVFTGGTLRVSSAALQLAPQSFHWSGGTLHLVASDLRIGTGSLFGESLALNARMGLQVDGALDVAAGASLLAGGGAISAAGGTNEGTIGVIGGSLTHSNPAVNDGNLDAIRATLSFPGDGIANDVGLTNHGVLTLADALVNGDVHSPAGSTINVAADVVFNGLVSGGGNFPGAGTVTFNGGYSPGDSPGTISFGGDLIFGSSATLWAELSGWEIGSYDRIAVKGILGAAGTLRVMLVDGFSPSAGDRFDLFDFGSMEGRFDLLALPALRGGLWWDASGLYVNGALAVVPEPGALGVMCLAGAGMMLRRHRTGPSHALVEGTGTSC